MRRIGRALYSALVLCCCALWGILGYLYYTMPDSITVTRGEDFHIGALVDSAPCGGSRSVASVGEPEQHAAYLRFLGLFPIKQAGVTVTDTPVVMVCGTPFGIKIYTEGVLIVGTGDVLTAAGAVNPATAAGLTIGDTILSVNGVAVTTNEQVAEQINRCGGRPVTMRVRRDGVDFDATFSPVRPLDGEGYRAGLWVRDSSAGVGMLTFYDPDSGVYAGLGHAVCDVDTGTQLSVSGGEIVPARIYEVRRSVVGTPGELQGGFEPGTLGKLLLNSSGGLYGTLSHYPLTGTTMPVAMKQQVHTGAAQILTTLEGTRPALYEVEIEQVRLNASSKVRNMVIRVTDEKLLSATGGIVQGMSGSPVLQNGRLIGAITHVLVNDPTRGYAIFAENMLETAQSVANSEKLRDAS